MLEFIYYNASRRTAYITVTSRRVFIDAMKRHRKPKEPILFVFAVGPGQTFHSTSMIMDPQ